MFRAWLKSTVRVAALATLAVSLVASVAAAGPRPGAKRAFNLFAGFLGRQNGNRWDCGLDADGHVCVDPNGSTTVGGGFWPKGTPDQYVFASGIQVAGIVDPASGFPWATDTTAAFFEDPSGFHENGEHLTLIYNSQNSVDAANWPRDAYVPNSLPYAPGLGPRSLTILSSHSLRSAAVNRSWGTLQPVMYVPSMFGCPSGSRVGVHFDS